MVRNLDINTNFMLKLKFLEMLKCFSRSFYLSWKNLAVKKMRMRQTIVVETEVRMLNDVELWI